MKRFRVLTEGGQTLRLYYPDLEIAQEYYPGVEIVEDNDQSHVPYIKQMLGSAVEYRTVARNGSIIYLLRFETSVGTCVAELSKDNSNGAWYDLCKYQLWKTEALVVPVLKTLCTPSEFCRDFLIPKAEYTVLCIGTKSEVKKPEVLKGIVKFASVSFEGMCQCQLFLNGWDLYIKHGDYFSPEYHNPEDCGTPLLYRLNKYGIQHGRKERFIYADCWGAIVLRRVAWIKISNFVSLVRHLNNVEVAAAVWPMIRSYHHWGNDEQNGGWNRFWGTVANTTRKYLNGIG